MKGVHSILHSTIIVALLLCVGIALNNRHFSRAIRAPAVLVPLASLAYLLVKLARTWPATSGDVALLLTVVGTLSVLLVMGSLPVPRLDPGRRVHSAGCDSPEKYVWIVLLVLGVAMALARFADLSVPAGFAIDEGTGAAHAVCLEREGTDADGKRWPLFARGIGGTHTPHFVYLAAGWSRLAGESPASFRGLAALVGFLSILFVALTAGRIGGREAAIAALVSGAVSPWVFHFSRVAWDPPLAILFLILALYGMVDRRHVLWALFAGIALASAVYCYPPQRLQVPLLLVLFWIFARHLRIDRRLLLVAIGVAAVGLCPLACHTVFGELQGRYAAIGVFGDAASMKQLSTTRKVVLVFENLWLHFRPGYLFVSGDQNPRHSTGLLGVISFLDLTVLVTGALVFFRNRKHVAGVPSVSLLLFCFVAYLTGILPAALTWESLPHALRSIGAWPFLVMGVGLVASALAKRCPSATTGILVSSVTASVVLIIVFFGPFARDPKTRRLFHEDVLTDAKLFLTDREDADGFVSRHRDPRLRYLVRYYLMTRGDDDCATSVRRIRRFSPSGQIAAIARVRTSGAAVIGAPFRVHFSSPADAGKPYLLAATFSPHPGTPLGKRVVPVTPDPLFGASQTLPTLFVNFLGTLDSAGRAAGTIHVPNVADLRGCSFYVSGVTLDPAHPWGVCTIGNAVRVVVR